MLRTPTLITRATQHKFSSPQRKRPRWLAKQQRAVPQHIGISFGSEKKPVAFLPRQPCEEDTAIFPQGSLEYGRDPVIELDDDRFADGGNNDLMMNEHNPTSSSGKSTSSSAASSSSSSSSQVPIALLESERLGLSPVLLQRLKTVFNITHLTPVQAKLLQRAFLLHDCAVSAETGSGKTLGLCIALVAKLLRNGPNRRGCAVFLVPTDTLVKQVVSWLEDLWPYEIDKKQRCVALGATAANDSGQTLFQRIKMRKPFIIVAVPQTFWDFYCRKRRSQEVAAQRKEDMKKEMVERILSGDGKNAEADFVLGYHTRKTVRYDRRGVLPFLDTLVVDEADSILPPEDPLAPGNLLLSDFTNPVKFKSPVQLILNSATLSPITVSHIRSFLKKNVFSSHSSRIFESDWAQYHSGGGTTMQQQQQRSTDSNSQMTEDLSTKSNDPAIQKLRQEERSMLRGEGSSAPTVRMSENISHQFLAADDPDELRLVLADVFRQFAAAVAASRKIGDDDDSAEREENDADASTTAAQQLRMKSHTSRQPKTQQQHDLVMAAAPTKNVVKYDADGYVIDQQEEELHQQMCSGNVDETEATTADQNKSISGMIHTSQTAVQSSKKRSNSSNKREEDRQVASNNSRHRRQRPKILILYPSSIADSDKNLWDFEEPQQPSSKQNCSGNNKSVDEDDDDDDSPLPDDDTDDDPTAAATSSPPTVKCAGNVTSPRELQDMVGELLRELKQEMFGDDHNAEDHGQADDESSSSSSSSLPFSVKVESAEEIRGFDDPNITVVVILARAENVREFVHWSGRVGRMGRRGDAVHVLSRTWVRSVADFCERLHTPFRIRKNVVGFS